MTDPVVIGASVVTVITALTTGIVTIVNAIAAARDRRVSREDRAALSETTTSTDRKADAIIEQGTAIHESTNGTLSKLQGKLDLANEKILSLEKLLATMVAAQGHRRSTDTKDPHE